MSTTASSTETGQITGTPDAEYNVLWFTENCLNNVLRLETFIADAQQSGDEELAELFRRAQDASRRGSEEGRAMLRTRLP